ncbi:MAG: hypothetical protein HY315_02895 [Acidobacteria bacterium]|nr:hypothetical protein [Acidobacteriota bacterium]
MSGTRTFPGISCKFSVLLAGSLLLFSCAKIADPRPPNLTPPSSIQDLHLEQQENRIILDFSMPTAYVDGQPLDLFNVAIYRLTLPRADQPPPLLSAQMEQSGQIVQRLGPDDLQKIVRNGRYRFEDVVAFPDRNFIFQRSFSYSLRFYSPRKVASSFSNLAFISPVAPALAPQLHPARAIEQAVALDWDAPRQNMDGSAPPRLVGYRIFRGATGRTLDRIADIEGDVRHYADAAVTPDMTYYYAVQARSTEEPSAFGPMSAVIAVSTVDVFPPAVPGGIGATVAGSRVELVWEPNSEIDLQGYNVYRSGALDGGFQKVNAALLSVNGLSDAPPSRGLFYYRVSAVDSKGNESAPSEALRVDFQ